MQIFVDCRRQLVDAPLIGRVVREFACELIECSDGAELSRLRAASAGLGADGYRNAEEGWVDRHSRNLRRLS
jgi:hypothetical protein